MREANRQVLLEYYMNHMLHFALLAKEMDVKYIQAYIPFLMASK